MHLPRHFAFAAFAAFLLFAGLGCQGTPADVSERAKPFTLKYWRVFDDQDAFDPILAAYRQLHPNITIEYRKLRFEEYERAILNGFAEDAGPDVLSLHNSWLGGWQQRLAPVPAALSVPFREVQGTIKKETITVLRQVPGMTPQRLANEFVKVVADDVVLPDETGAPRVYGLPLSVDTMVLYYNRDMLNASGIAQPPATWVPEFQDQVKKIAKLDDTGAIIQSAAAMGTAQNIERASDILALLMMQNCTPMTDANGVVTFDRPAPPECPQHQLPPGAEALSFYTDFANPEKVVYTWNDKMPSSYEAFVTGKTAFFLGYAYHQPLIKTRNPRLNFGIAPMPQVDPATPKYYANYWVEAVSNKTEHLDEAWDFVQFITSAAQVQHYLNATRKPTALSALVSGQLEDLELTTFAAQLPNARSWYHGTDAAAMEKAFQDMIVQMLAAEADPVKIMQLGATKVNQTIK